jgi:hypothetical protein
VIDNRERCVINGHPGYYYETTATQPELVRGETEPALVFEREGTVVMLSPCLGTPEWA